MNLLVGCPVLRREWIIEDWVDYVEASCAAAGIEPTYIFAADPRDPTVSLIGTKLATIGRDWSLVEVLESVDRPAPNHAWGDLGALDKMVWLRNTLLEAVREQSPDLFLSLDSDILCHPQQITNLLDTITSRFDAVGGKVFLGQGKAHPSWARYSRERGLQRSDSSLVMEVDVIMAMKLMLPSAYHVDYEYEANGEDIGWSIRCRDKGLHLGWDGRVCSKHILYRYDENGQENISKVDWRVGF